MSCSSFRDRNRGLSLTLAKIRKESMGQLPGEILKEEFFKEIGVSQNQLAQAIGVPGNRIHAIVNGTRDITADTDLRLCKFFRRAIFCVRRMPTTCWRLSFGLRVRWRRSNATSRTRRHRATDARARSRPCKSSDRWLSKTTPDAPAALSTKTRLPKIEGNGAARRGNDRCNALSFR